MEYQFQQSAFGHVQDKYLLNELMNCHTTSMSSQTSLLNQNNLPPLVNILYTQESLLKNNQMILNDNQTILNQDIQNTNSLLILDQVLTSTEQVLKPFWKPCSQEISKKLWLPTKTDFHDLDLISSHGSSHNLEQNLKLWKTKDTPEITEELQNLLKISWKSLQSFPQGSTVKESILCTRKIRFYPNKEQLKLFTKCFKAHRFCYNNAVAEINNRYSNRKAFFNNCKKCLFSGCTNLKDVNYFCKEHHGSKINWNLDISLPSVRKDSMDTDNCLRTGELWLKTVPFDTRGHGVQDAVSAYKTCVANMKTGHIKHFKLQYKKCTEPSKIFWVCAKASFNCNNSFGIFKQRLKNKASLKFLKKDQEWLVNTFPNYVFNNDFKVLCQAKNQYYLVVNYERKKEDHPKECLIASLDPGVRTFQTMYSEAGIVGEFGACCKDKVYKLFNKIDKIRSVRSKAKKRRTKRNARLRELKLHKKLHDTVSNLHNQTAAYLSKTYKTVLLPEFGISKMLKETTLSSNVKRELMSLRFYDFKQKLNHLCSMNNSKLIIVSEAYTTRTCTQCGTLNNNIKGKKTFECEKCHLIIDRDINASRNILLKRCTS